MLHAGSATAAGAGVVGVSAGQSHPTEEGIAPKIDQICPQTVASAWVADAVRARSAALRSSRLTRWFRAA